VILVTPSGMTIETKPLKLKAPSISFRLVALEKVTCDKYLVAQKAKVSNSSTESGMTMLVKAVDQNIPYWIAFILSERTHEVRFVQPMNVEIPPK
jgi:hypothetical protein